MSSALFALAVQCHRAGDLALAEQYCRQVVEADPCHADAHHFLGVLAYQAGRFEEAIASIRTALSLSPAMPHFYNHLGLAQIAVGQPVEAVASLQQALRLQPNYAIAHSNLALALNACGQFAEAAQHARQAIALQPDYAQAHTNLVQALAATGNVAEAELHAREAVRLQPNYADGHLVLGDLLSAVGKPEEALASFQQAIGVQPDCSEAWNNAGVVLTHLGRPQEGAAHIRQALQLKPDYANAHNSLALALTASGQFADAEAHALETIRLRPGHARGYITLGYLLSQAGRQQEALSRFKQAINVQPDCSEAWDCAGATLADLGKADEGIAHMEQALRLQPDNVQALTNLGAGLERMGRLEVAAAHLQRAIQLRPGFYDAWNNLGSVLRNQGKLTDAIRCFEQALTLQPGLVEVYQNLAHALADEGKLDRAIVCCRRILEQKADHAQALGQLLHWLQQTCCWDELDGLAQRLLDLVDRSSASGLAHCVAPFLFLTLATETPAAQQLHYAQKWLERFLQCAEPSGLRSTKTRFQPPAKITLGYLSADFHNHATAYLMAELFEKHDRERFNVIGLSYGPDDGGSMRQRLIKAFDRFVDLKDMSFAQAAQRIEAEGVDILIDLKGYTENARTQILALRPAPVQVNYLGYPGTMGAPFMDYILVDDFIVPPDQQPFFTEKLVHLPGCYQVNDSQREVAAETPSRAACGLPDRGFVFCSFNNNYKITPAIFDVWMRLLKAVDGSVLWLLEGNRFVADNLRKEAQRRGVAPGRLVFAPRQPLPLHLARHRQADLFLDTFPYTAHTTTSDSLWVGCPVLTMAGATFVSRVAGSLVRAVGLPELITTSLDEYEALAVQLAQNPDRLGELRARLAANRQTCGLFDGGRFARGVERAFSTLWEIHCAGEKPRAFVVDA